MGSLGQPRPQCLSFRGNVSLSLVSCFSSTELKATGTAHFFNFLLNTTDYRILLKDEDHDRMYVGSKDYVLSLDLHDINREPLIVRAGPEMGRGRVKGVEPRVRVLASRLHPLTFIFGRSIGQPPRSALRSAYCQARMAT